MKNLAPISWNGPRPQTEIELLSLQEQQAKAALKNTFEAGVQQLKDWVDLRPMIQEHPWKSSGAAALVGFVVAVTATAPSGETKSAPENTAAGAGEAASTWSSLTSLLLSTGTEALKSAVTPWLAQKIQDVLPGSEKATDKAAPTPPADDSKS